MKKESRKLLLQRVASRFVAAKPNRPVYLASCCDRVLITYTEPKVCSTCKGVPDFVEIDKEDVT